MAQKFYSWRDELREVADIPSSEPETEDKSERKIKETNVKNKIKINPTMGEAFEAIGGTLLEVVEIEEGDLGMLQQKRARVDMKIAKERTKMAKKAKKSGEDVVTEKMDMKKADMGDVVKDFYKSDAPQFKGKSKEKRREMAIAAKLQAEKPQ